MFAPSYLAATVSILSVVFPDIEVEALNTTVNTIVAIVAALVIMIRQIVNRRSTLGGFRPK